MVLEAAIVCLDNSEFMRNGDFVPTRFESQREAASMLCDAKLQSNAESTVGLMSMANKREVLATLTTDYRKILNKLHKVNIGGSIDFTNSMQIAYLALKHRQAKNHAQRIIVFVGSPLSETPEMLKKLGSWLKKNSVSVDLINFGESEENEAKLEVFINSVNKEDSSHLVTVPPGSGSSLLDALIGSPVLGGANGENNLNEFGIDPNLDPELAMALRISMEEAMQRQQQSGAGEPAAAEAQQAMETDDMDDELRAALALSLGDTPAENPPAESNNTDAAAAAAPVAAAALPAAPSEGGMVEMPPNFDSMTEEEQMEWAIRLSMGAGGDDAAAASADNNEEKKKMDTDEPDGTDDMLNNPEFLSSVLGSLPGVDPNDAQIKDILSSAQGDKKEDKDKKDEDK